MEKDYIKSFSQIIDSEIEKMAFNRREPAGLYSPVDYILSKGGKRLRPVMALMSCRIFSDDLSPCIKPALAIELFHNFTLLHDDIMDKADMRRNKPTVHKKWNENTAILSGDVMVVLSFQLISSANPEILPELLSMFNRTAIEVCEGQQMDMSFEQEEKVDESSYLEMIRLKTSVLIAAAMNIGAIAGGASAKDAALMYECGLNLGIGFQLQDDLLDLYADQKEFGKKQGGDILMNKKTFLLIKALQTAGADDSASLRYLLAEEKNPEKKVTGVKKIFDKLQIEKITREKAAYYFKESKSKLENTSCPERKKKELLDFIEYVMHRRS